MIARIGGPLSAYSWLAAIIFAALLCVLPAIDIWFSGLFFVSELGAWMPRSTLMRFARSGVPPLIIGTLIVVVLIWMVGFLRRHVVWGVTGRRTAYLVVSLAVGPGLVVESLLKTQYGRVRPKDTTIFGGEDVFTAALWPADACERNCSFVSGHAAVAFWVTAFAFLLPNPYRLPFILGGLALGVLMGLARIVEGAHFLSDVVFAGLIVVGLNMWLARRVGLAGPGQDISYGS